MEELKQPVLGVKIDVLEAALNENTKSFLDEFHGLSKEQINWKPNDKAWSIGEIILHLIQVTDSYIPLINDIENLNLPFIAKFGFVPRLFGNLLLKAVEPTRKRKSKTFSIWNPTEKEISENILYKYSKKKHELVLLLKKSEKHIENGALIHSPANKQIVYSLENAFKIIIDHEKRHFFQAKELISNT